MNLISKLAFVLRPRLACYAGSALAMLLAGLLAGCVSSGGEGAVGERYLPAVDATTLALVFPGEEPTAVTPVAASPAPHGRVGRDPVPPMRSRQASEATHAGVQIETPVGAPDPIVATPPAPTPVATVPAPPAPLAGRGRVLQHGSRVVISLLSIPKPMEIQDKIDDQGRVSLPFIGQLKIAGMSTSAAEALIEKTYIDEEIFVKVDAAIVPEEQVFYIRGQVNRKGKFPMSREVTLLQAISEAGGFTPFARESKIQITRHATGEIEFHDAKRISKGQDPNPVIQPNDNINVHRRLY
jgi:protein involved in polysaccharide export with SLBB domain